MVLKNKCLIFGNFLFMCKGFRLGCFDFFRAYVPPTRRAMPQKAERGFQKSS